MDERLKTENERKEEAMARLTGTPVLPADHPRRYRPPRPSAMHGYLYEHQKRVFTVWPLIHRTRPGPDDHDGGDHDELAARIQFRYVHQGTWAVPEIPVEHAKGFCNKATVLYVYAISGTQDHQVFRTALELWIRLTADQVIALPGFGHYPITPVRWHRTDDPPTWLEAIQTHQRLAKRVREHEGHMCFNAWNPGATTHHYVVRDPFPRCLILSGRFAGLESEWETWLLGEKRLMGDVGEDIERSGEGPYTWVRRKMELEEALTMTINFPEEKLEANAFRIRWDQMTERDHADA